MDLTPSRQWQPPPDWRRLVAIESHTGGEPFRVIVEGLDEIPGDTMAQRRMYAEENLDAIRRATMLEPRGHDDMYGGWPGPPVEEGSDLSVLFTHNDGFSTMCGHGIIALSKVLIDTGIVEATEPETTLRIDTPAGTVTAVSNISDGVVTSTTFDNVPSFALSLDARVEVPGYGTVEYDLAFGGAFYAITPAADLGLSLDDPGALVSAGRALKSAIGDRGCRHPLDSTLDFLYGVIFTGPSRDSGDSRNVCVFADGEIDRSPTGTGVSARLAVAHARGEVGVGEGFSVESIVGSVFSGTVAAETSVDGRPVIIPRISGSAAITGRTELWVDPDDGLGRGFRVG